MRTTYTRFTLLLHAVLFCSSLPAIGQICFNQPVRYSTNAKSVTMTVGDFTGDGKPDIAVPGFQTSNVVLMKNNGYGALLAPVSFPVMANPGHIASADFNNDNKRDIMVTHAATNGGPPYYMTVMLGDGAGGFGTPMVQNLSSGLGFQAFFDFNSDGNIDFVGVKASDTLGIWYGDGQGHFVFEKNISLMGGPAMTTLIEDCNNDAIDDIIVCFGLSHNLNRVMGQGSGSFGNAINIGSGIDAVDIAMADLDGDGKKDIVTASSFPSKSMFLKGLNGGSFAYQVAYNTVQNPEDIVLQDFDNDGKKDVIVSSYWESEMSFLRGNGDGTFQNAISFDVGLNPEELFAADFNSDGRMDVATVDLYDNKVSIMLNCTPVGLNEVSPDAALIAYPNPAHQRVVVQTGGSHTLRLLAVDGTLCRQWQAAEDTELSLDLQGIPPGIYLLQGIGQKGVSQRRIAVR
jgi:hypothetical protein